MTQSDDRLEIETEAFHMIYDKKKFSEEGLFIDVKYDFTNYGGSGILVQRRIVFRLGSIISKAQ